MDGRYTERPLEGAGLSGTSASLLLNFRPITIYNQLSRSFFKKVMHILLFAFKCGLRGSTLRPQWF